jgi:hypothetical protein
LVKNRLIPEGAFLDVYSFRVVQAWELMEPMTVLARHNVSAAVWENFEYLYVRAQEWTKRHPEGRYPKHVRRATLPRFEEVIPDAQYGEIGEKTG